VHEVFGLDDQWLRPYADYETYWGTEAEMLANKWSEWEKCLAKLREVWGETAQISGCEACGYKQKKGKWITSFHCTANAIGAYRCGADIARAGLVPKGEGFDTQPYGEVGSRRNLRMVGQTNSWEPNRSFRYILKKSDGNWGSVDIWNVDAEARKKILILMLVQFSFGEDKIEVEQVRNQNVNMLIEDEKVIALGKNGLPLGDDIKLTSVAQVRALCRIAGKFEEVDRNYNDYINLMFALRNTADCYKLNVIEMRELALELAAVCPNNDPKHAEQCFNYTGGRSQTRKRQLIAHLRKEAGEKDPNAYASWLKPLREARDEADPLMDEIKNLDWNDRELAKFKDYLLCVGRKWVSLMRMAEVNERKVNEYTDARMKRMKEHIYRLITSSLSPIRKCSIKRTLRAKKL